MNYVVHERPVEISESLWTRACDHGFNMVNIENKLPKVTPVLPLKYSNGSGVFFCVIIEEPV